MDAMRSKKTLSTDALLEQIRALAEENGQLRKALADRDEAVDNLAKLTRRIADNAPDMIWAKDMENRYLFANRALCNGLLMCQNPEAAVGKNDLYFAECERANGQRHTFGEICANSDEIVKSRNKAMRFIEDGLVRGRYLVLDVHKAPLLDESGSMIGTVGCGRDITREREIQAELQRSRAGQQLLMETAAEFAVFRIQMKPLRPRELSVVFISPSAKEIAGIDRAMPLSQWFKIHPRDRRAFRLALINAVRSGKFNHRFRVFHPASAQWRWMHMIASRVGGTKTVYINGIIFDSTEAVSRTEALAAKEREWETRSDNLSEVNTALKVLLKKRDQDRRALEEKVLYNVKSLIRPYLKKLQDSGLNPKQSAYLEILESNLNEIVSPLSRKLSYDYLGFTPTEIKVAAMVKQGKKAPEIARLLGISTRTVEGYRYSIRDRLGIKGKKVNLRTYLLSMK